MTCTTCNGDRVVDFDSCDSRGEYVGGSMPCPKCADEPDSDGGDDPYARIPTDQIPVQTMRQMIDAWRVR